MGSLKEVARQLNPWDDNVKETVVQTLSDCWTKESPRVILEDLCQLNFFSNGFAWANYTIDFFSKCPPNY
jgi:hypothetical protein